MFQGDLFGFPLALVTLALCCICVIHAASGQSASCICIVPSRNQSFKECNAPMKRGNVDWKNTKCEAGRVNLNLESKLVKTILATSSSAENDATTVAPSRRTTSSAVSSTGNVAGVTDKTCAGSTGLGKGSDGYPVWAVVVAFFGGFLLAVLLLILWFFLRRRREHKKPVPDSMINHTTTHSSDTIPVYVDPAPTNLHMTSDTTSFPNNTHPKGTNHPTYGKDLGNGPYVPARFDGQTASHKYQALGETNPRHRMASQSRVEDVDEDYYSVVYDNGDADRLSVQKHMSEKTQQGDKPHEGASEIDTGATAEGATGYFILEPDIKPQSDLDPVKVEPSAPDYDSLRGVKKDNADNEDVRRVNTYHVL